MSLRRTVCAWGALAAFVLGGCMLDTTGTEPGDEELGSDSQELLPGEVASPPDPVVDGEAVDEEPDDPTAPDDEPGAEQGPDEWGPGYRVDPSPDPWMDVVHDSREASHSR